MRRLAIFVALVLTVALPASAFAAQRITASPKTVKRAATFRWIPKNKNIGRGDWTPVARMRCESGKDGSTHFVRATTPITVD